MAATKTTKITVNTQEARDDLKAMKERLKENRQEFQKLSTEAKKVGDDLTLLQKSMTKLEKAGKESTDEYKQLETQFNALSETSKKLRTQMGGLLDKISSDGNSIKYLDDQLSTCDAVIKDLANSSLRQLTGATREATRKLRDMSSSSKGLDEMHERMAKFTREAKFVKGEFVDVSKGIKNLSEQSDRWLSKAIKGQEDLVASLKKSDAEYGKQLAILRQLQAEQDKRDGKIDYNRAQVYAKASNVSATELRQAKSAITKHRDNATDARTIAEDNKMLDDVQKKLDIIEGKEQKVAIGWKKMKQVLSDPSRAAGEDIKQTMDAIQQKIAKLPAGSQRVADLRKEYQELDQTLKGTKMSQQQLNDIIKRSKTGNASIEELKKAYKQLEDELSHIKDLNGSAFKNGQKDLKQLKKQIDEVTGAAQKQGGALQTALRNIAAYGGVMEVFRRGKELFLDFFKLNMEFSDQLVNIRKVSNLAMSDIEHMSKNLAKIDTRTTIQELNDIAYAGAKLGIGDYGAAQLEGFVRAANQVNVALKEDLGEEALTALSKITEVMGLIPKLGVEDAMLRTGSAIFKLANTSTATSGKIIDFSNRLLSLGKQGAMSTADILALGAAVDAMAVEPEVAATAFNKMIVEIRKGTSSLENDLGITQGRLKELVESGKGMQAIQEIFQAMHGKENVFALENLFGDLGSEGGARMIRTMVTMADNVGILDKAVKNANTAFDEGTAITQEYNMQQQTAAAFMERASNLWEKAFINASNANGPIKEIAQSWFEMTEDLVGAGEATGGFKLAIDSLVFSIKLFMSLIPALVSGLMAKGIGAALTALGPMFKAAFDMGVAGIRSLIPALNAGATATGGFTKKWKAMDAAMKSNVIGLVIGLFVQLVYWASQYERELTVAERAQKTLNEIQKEANRQAQDQILNVQSLAAVARDETAALEDRITAINALNELVPDYNGYLDETTGKYKENKKALDDYVTSLIHSYEVEGAKAKLAEIGAKKAQAKIDRFEAQKELSSYQPTQYNSFASSATGNTGMFAAGYDTGAKAAIQNRIDKAQKDIDDAEAEERIIQDVYGNDIKKNALDSVRPTGKKVGGGDGGGSGSGSGSTSKNKSLRDELRQKQDEANAIIDNVRNFYERQINAKLSEAIGLGMDKTEQDLFVEPVKERMNMALEQVRLAIAGQANTWEEFKLTMKNDLVEQADETGINLSQGLLDGITANNIDALRARLQQLGDSLSKPLNSILAEVFAKATKNAQANLKLTIAQQEARQKEINEHNYTGTVTQNSYDQFNTLGFANPTDAEVSDKAAFDKRKQNIISMFENARTDIVSVFSADVSTEEGRGLLMQILFGSDPDGMGARIAAVLGDDLSQWQLFYQKLIQYSDEYTQAEKKQADERKKINDFGFSLSNTSKFDQAAIDLSTKQKKESSRQYSFGAKNDAISPWGQTEATDPELALLQLKMKLAKDYYAYIKAHGATDEQLIEAGKNVQEAYSSIMDAIVTKAKATAEAQMKWYKPIEQYGTALGEAMMDESKTVKDATRDMINSFIDLTGEYVNQKLTQWIMTKLYNTFIAESENELAAQKQANAVTNATTAVTEASVEVPAGIAAASAKTLGQLGWWGIPLIAVIGGVLGGLMALAKGALSKAFGSKTPDVGKTNTKLVSGMLTYDRGNVSRVIPMLDNGNVQDLHPFVDKDGSIYWAVDDKESTHKGVSLYNTPTATTVNGRPSLVAEQGPELVIGRETTQAIMQNNPALLRALYQYDKHHSGRTAYDRGNLAEFGASSATDGVTTPTSAVTIQRDPEMLALMQALLIRLNEPIKASIDMYGRGNLYDSMTRASHFMHNKQ